MHSQKLQLLGGTLNDKEIEMRIRKLTPLECLKLMGFERKDYQAMRDIGMSDSQIYHCAGDSLIPNIVAALIGQMTELTEQEVFNKIESYTEQIKES